jgi:hypothetical protein
MTPQGRAAYLNSLGVGSTGGVFSLSAHCQNLKPISPLRTGASGGKLIYFQPEHISALLWFYAICSYQQNIHKKFMVKFPENALQ